MPARPRLALHMAAWALTGVLVAVLLHALAGLAWPPALAFAVSRRNVPSFLHIDRAAVAVASRSGGRSRWCASTWRSNKSDSATG